MTSPAWDQWVIMWTRVHRELWSCSLLFCQQEALMMTSHPAACKPAETSREQFVQHNELSLMNVNDVKDCRAAAHWVCVCQVIVLMNRYSYRWWRMCLMSVCWGFIPSVKKQNKKVYATEWWKGFWKIKNNQKKTDLLSSFLLSMAGRL